MLDRPSPDCRQPALLLAALLLAGAPLKAQDLGDKAIADALKGDWGQIKLDLRYRYENVDDELPSLTDPSGNGSNLRVRIGYLTPKFHGFQAFAEYEGNHPVFVDDDFNSGINGKLGFPIIADPERDEVNQLWLSYSGIPDTEIKVGRQRITLDNHRFIGNVGFRQLEQTYDAALLTNQSLPDTTIHAGYLRNQRNIFSDDVFLDGGIFNVAYAGFQPGKLTGYAYLLDFDGVNSNSTQTYGLRFKGGTPLGFVDGLKAVYTLEYAHQLDLGQNPVGFDADYFLVEGGADYAGFTLKGAVEFLGSDGGRIGFRTPLATLHAFQGFADVFLLTPDQGIVDAYGYLGYEYAPWGLELKVVYHDFRTDEGDIDLGSEIDAEIQKNFGKHYFVNLKYASYDADPEAAAATFSGSPQARFANDLQRFWVQAGIQY